MSEARHRHLQVDVISYNAVMAACSEGTQWQVAVGLFQAGRIFLDLKGTRGWEYLVAILEAIGNIIILVIFPCL